MGKYFFSVSWLSVMESRSGFFSSIMMSSSFSFVTPPLSLSFRIRCACESEGVFWVSSRVDAFSNGKMIAFTVGNARNLLNQADEVIDWIENSSPESELDKVLLLDLWFQKNIQYIKGRESIAGGKTYVCEEISRESQTEDVLLSHFGVCADIAFTACLILNHPRMNIYCRQIHSEEQQHSWNVIKLNEKEFYTDFTHNITRNPYRLSETLMTTAYCCDNTLLGKTEACVKYGVPSNYTGIDLSDISYSRVDINNCLQRFRIGGINLTWNPIPVKKQHLQPEQK